jgi:hypothetical protein
MREREKRDKEKKKRGREKLLCFFSSSLCDLAREISG